MEHFVKIENLEKIYPNGAKAVYNFNLDIKENEFIVLVGPSGCGKSTMLRMIAGLEDITGGDLTIAGEYANYKPSKDRKLAIVFQNYALYPQMNVFENIAFPLTLNKYSFPVVDAALLKLRDALQVLQNVEKDKILTAIKEADNKKFTNAAPALWVAKSLDISRGGAEKILSFDLLAETDFQGRINKEIQLLNADIDSRIAEIEKAGKKVNLQSQYLDKDGNVVTEMRNMTKDEIQDKVFAAADILDLGPYLNRLPKQLSGGQMQRVALGRAIVKNVPLFLMDEPLSNLDARLRLTMRSEIVKLHKKINATTIYVTHDQTEAMSMADRIVVMSKGFVQQIDTPEKIYNDPQNIFVAKFVGTPPINILDGRAEGNIISVADDYKIQLSDEKARYIADFYKETYEKFQTELDNYDGSEKSKEFILKVLSATETEQIFTAETKKQGKLAKLFAKIKGLGKKQTEEKVDVLLEKLKEKTQILKDYSENGCNVTLGLRPESVHIEKFDGGNGGGYLVKPILVELMGSEFYVHFNFAGKEMIAKVSAKENIDEDTEFSLTISNQDIFIFDPVSGNRIC